MKTGIPQRFAALAAALTLGLLGLAACNDNNAGTPPADSLTISATSANVGDPVTLTWTSSSNVTVCTASGNDATDWSGVIATNGSLTFMPAASGNFTYTLNCYSVGAVATTSVMLEVKSAVVAVTPTGQSLAGIDPVNNTVWVPTYQLDGSGNLQLVVSNQSDVTPAAVSAVGARAVVQPHATGTGKKVSLPQCDTPIALAYDTNNQTFLVECANSSTTQVYVQIVKTAPLDNLNNPSVTTITATGVFWDTWGGILFNPNTDKAVVAGTNTVGILDVPKDGTPSFEANSVVQVPGTDSLSLNFTTQLLMVCSDGTNYTIDTSVRGPNGQLPAPALFDGPSGTTDGNAFDSATNIAVISPEFQNIAEIANFTGQFDAAGSPPPQHVPVLTIPGLGWLAPEGEGPGGQATFNSTTHQALIADEFGQNFWLVQLPSAAVTGALDNNGQPGSATTADASSAFAVAAGLIPQVTINNVSTQLGIRGDPAALGIDQVHNIAYMLADTDNSYHTWNNNANTPLFLIAVDLSNAPVGGCATGITLDGTSNGQRSPACTSVWSPKVAVLRIN